MCLALCVMMILSFVRGGLGLHGKAQKLTGRWGTMQLPGRKLGAVGMLLCKVEGSRERTKNRGSRRRSDPSASQTHNTGGQIAALDSEGKVMATLGTKAGF